MTPDFRVTADASDISESIKSRLLDISVQDNAGLHNDRLSIRLDDRPTDGQFIEVPATGTKMKVWMGYRQAQNQVFPYGLREMGEFTLDEIEFEKSSSGRVITLGAHAADTEGTLKQQRTRSYHEKKLGDIISECAKRNDLQPVIDQRYGSIHVPHIDQTNESDGSFLTRLYDLYGAIAKITHGKLLFGDPDGIRKLTGEDRAGEITLDEGAVLGYRFLNQGRSKHSKAKAKYHDKDKSEIVAVDSDETEAREKVTTTDPVVYPNEHEAKSASQSKKNALDKSECSIHISCVGDPLLIAGGKVNLVNFRPNIPTTWVLTKVTHKISNDGYKTDIEGGTKDTTKEGKGGRTGKVRKGGTKDSDIIGLEPDLPDSTRNLPDPDLPQDGTGEAPPLFEPPNG